MATSTTDLRTLAAAADGLAAAAQHLVPSAKLTMRAVTAIGTGVNLAWSSQDGKRSVWVEITLAAAKDSKGIVPVDCYSKVVSDDCPSGATSRTSITLYEIPGILRKLLR